MAHVILSGASVRERGRRTVGALLLAAMLASCSGGADSGVAPAAAPLAHARWSGKTGVLKISIHVPTPKRMRAIHAIMAKAAARRTGGKVKPSYLPDSVTELDFDLVNPTGDDGTFSFTVDPQTDSHCTLVSTGPTPGYDCEGIEHAAPATTDTYQITACDCTVGAVAETVATFEVPINGSYEAAFTLDPIVGGLAWNVGTESGTAPFQVGTAFPNGQDTPSWSSGSGYSCPSPPDGGCYDPLVNDSGTAAYDTATLEVLDPAGEIIVPTVGAESGSPYLPIYLDASGFEVDVAVYCPDQSLGWLSSAASEYGTIPVATAYDVMNPNFAAYGFSNDTWGTSPGYFNSPDAQQEGTGYGTIYFDGSQSNKVYGNDGAYMNFNAAASDYGASPIECVAAAYDAAPSSEGFHTPNFNQGTYPYYSDPDVTFNGESPALLAPYWMGPALGGGTPVVNSRHKRAIQHGALPK